MNVETTPHKHFCDLFSVYLADEKDMDCRCTMPHSDMPLNKELLSKWQVGEATL